MKQSKKITGPEIHLIDGADYLIKAMKTPAELLDFLSEAMTWIDSYKEEDVKLSHEQDTFFIKAMIDVIVQPWFKNEKAKENILIGLKSIQDLFGAEGYEKNIAFLVTCFGISLKHGLYVDMIKYFTALNILSNLSAYIEKYEQEMFKDIEKNKLSKAA